MKPLHNRLAEGFGLGLLVTLGFLVIFGTAGLVISAGLRVLVRWMPLAALLAGVALVLLGLWLLAGKSLPFALPVVDVDLRARNYKTVFLFGAAYGFASLSCTLPIFLVVVGTSLTSASLGGSAAMFLSYAAEMSVVLMSVAIGAALLKGTITEWFRGFLPYVNRIGAVMLILAGAYLIWYQGRYLPLVLAGL